MAERILADDDPENPKTYLDKFKRPTPGETILAMLAEPSMTMHVSQSRMCGSAVEIRVSGRDWHTYQFEDALRRYQVEQTDSEAAKAYEAALLRQSELSAHMRKLEGRLPDHLVGVLRAERSKKDDPR